MKDQWRGFLSHWDWRLFLLILLYFVLPSIYQSFRVYLIGNELPTTEGLAIASQWQFVQIIFEIVQEATVLPIFFFLGRHLHSSEIEKVQRLQTALGSIVMVNLILTVLLLINLQAFVEVSGLAAELHSQTITYLSIKIWSAFLGVISLGILTIIESLNEKGILLLFIVAKMVLMIALDSLLIGGFPFSLDWGIQGEAITSLLVELVLFLTGLVLILKSLQTPLKRLISPPYFNGLREFIQIGGWIWLESLVKNLAYWYLILKLINQLGTTEIGGYYLAMHLLWSFALIPILAISETSKVLIGNHADNLTKVKSLLKGALLLSCVVLLLWFIFFIFRTPILAIFSQDSVLLATANEALVILAIPYVFLTLNMVIDSLFYGLGKTQFLTYQSLLTNGTVYLGAYILYLFGIWTPDFKSVLVLFGLGILVDSILTFFFAFKALNPKESRGSLISTASPTSQ